MQTTDKLIRETDANNFDTCILETGFLHSRILTAGRLTGWKRCEQTHGGYGNWFLIFVYPLYKMTQLDENRFCKDVPPDNNHFTCVFVHGRAAVDVIHKYTTYNNKSKFAIAFAEDDKHQFHFSTPTEEKFTFEVILIDSLIFLSGNLTPLSNDFDRQKKREFAHIERYLSTKGLFCSEICKISEKDINVIIIFEREDGFNASNTEMEQEFAKLHNLTRRVHLKHEAATTQSDEDFPLIDLTEPEDKNTPTNISENSSDPKNHISAKDNGTNHSLASNILNSNYSKKSNEFETSESEKKIESKITTNSEELRHAEKSIVPLCETVMRNYKILGNRRVTDGYDFGSSRNNRPPFLPTSFKIMDSLQSIAMSVMIDCDSPQTELRSRGAYDLEFDKFLANKNKQ